MKTINVGLIGLGFIGKVHTIAYKDIPLCINHPLVGANLSALLRSRLDTEQEATGGAGYGVTTTSPDEFFSQPLQLVDICTPNNLHLEQCQRAIAAGMSVYCEKPLAVSYEEALLLADLAEKAGVITQVAFVMRYLPAIKQMKALVAAGEIGEILNFRGHMFHGSYLDPNRLMSWRLKQSESGGGAFIDLGAHLVDMALYILGDIKSVRAQMHTFIQERFVDKKQEQREVVDVDDWTLCTLELKNGATGVIEVTRMAAGASEESSFEIYGTKGALIYREKEPNDVQYYSQPKGEWITGPTGLSPIEGERPLNIIYPGSKYSQGMMTNIHLASEYDLLLNIFEQKYSANDFRSASRVQQVIEAAYSSAKQDGLLYKLE